MKQHTTARELLRLEPQHALHRLAKMGAREFATLATEVLELQETQRREHQLLAYVPVSDEARRVHQSTARVLGVFGGNGSSKTETCLAHLAAFVTGIVPESLRDDLNVSGWNKPRNCRVVVESLTTTLYPIILPKLQWWHWTGIDAPGGERGHWGWIPRDRLLGGTWQKAWSDKLRILKVLHHNPNTGRYDGDSTIQFLSKDNDPSDFASGDFDMILHDEPPHLSQWRENEARTMRVNGRMMMAMTWPDDPTIPVDWVYDEVFEPGQSEERTDIECINLWTTDNPHLDQEAIKAQSEKWDEATRRVRIYGEPMRFSALVHPLFTDRDRSWCFDCNAMVLLFEGACACGSSNVETYNHVQDFDPVSHYPTVFLLDMHPRKPHMGLWVQIDPADDLHVVAEAAVDGDPVEYARHAFDIERSHHLDVVLRLCDPNMGLSPASAQRGITWRDEFDAAGLLCDLADDAEAGRKRLNVFLAPDSHTRRPRVRFRLECIEAVKQMKRYQWDDHKRALDKDQKQKPKQRYDDFPTLLKYLMNYRPEYRSLRTSGVIHRSRHGVADDGYHERLARVR